MPSVEDFLTDARDAATMYKQKLQDALADIEQEGNGLASLVEARTAIINYRSYAVEGRQYKG